MRLSPRAGLACASPRPRPQSSLSESDQRPLDAGGQGPSWRAALLRARRYRQQAEGRDAKARHEGLAVHAGRARADSAVLLQRRRRLGSPAAEDIARHRPAHCTVSRRVRRGVRAHGARWRSDRHEDISATRRRGHMERCARCHGPGNRRAVRGLCTQHSGRLVLQRGTFRGLLCMRRNRVATARKAANST
jgi:hypothetical protein